MIAENHPSESESQASGPSAPSPEAPAQSAESQAAGKPAKADKPAKAPKAPKAGKAASADKAAGETAAASKAPAEPPPPPRLREKYRTQVVPALMREFGIRNPMAVPKLEKVVLTVGVGKHLEGSKLNPKVRETVIKDLALITGQRPVLTKAKKSVANFKLRAGYEIGAMVTLRGARMWEFVDRLMTLAIPRIKDFRGLSPRSFDGRGNYSFGVSEQGIFPEINMAETEFTHGMNITFVFRNSDDRKSLFALRELGMPFARAEDLAAARKK